MRLACFLAAMLFLKSVPSWNSHTWLSSFTHQSLESSPFNNLAHPPSSVVQKHSLKDIWRLSEREDYLSHVSILCENSCGALALLSHLERKSFLRVSSEKRKQNINLRDGSLYVGSDTSTHSFKVFLSENCSSGKEHCLKVKRPSSDTPQLE